MENGRKIIIRKALKTEKNELLNKKDDAATHYRIQYRKHTDANQCQKGGYCVCVGKVQAAHPH